MVLQLLDTAQITVKPIGLLGIHGVVAGEKLATSDLNVI
jgi:hypothetical protein